ncbi:hypothetical protein IWX49DRAFT_534943 [Phyllosticta citricarpa]|uniref:ubiquitinyl hydrolase 1 n=2 Tax=Phyllosticta TaxID=121621 RepID=A0ABR1MJC0_9PEZI
MPSLPEYRNMDFDNTVIDFLVNHLVLPPKLPQDRESEDDEIRCERELLRFVMQTITTFTPSCSTQAKAAWKSARFALQNWEKSLMGSSIGPEKLAEMISNIKVAEPIMIHVKAANTGLLIRRTEDDQVIFDAFEASSKSSIVIQTKGRLLQTFPGRSVIVPFNICHDKRLAEELAAKIQDLHKECVPSMMETDGKGLQTAKDERDSNPGMVTELLLSTIAALGDNFDSPKVHKHVRDEVNWDRGKRPWRRSPFWLVVRVSLNLILRDTFDVKRARVQWKNFVAFLITGIKESARHEIQFDVKAIINVKLARKLTKLGRETFAFVATLVEKNISDFHGSLDSSWSKIQRAEYKSLEKQPLPIPTESDTGLLLSHSRRHLLEAIQDDRPQTLATDFAPSEPVSLRFSEDGLPSLDECLDPQGQIFLLDDFEKWVLESLCMWKQGQENYARACELVAAIMKSYLALARPLYSDNARANSVMLLTVLEIWRVLDLLCLEAYPMLSEYGPEIALQTLEPLLLPQLYHMEKLLQIEEHLENRHSASTTDTRILQDPRGDSFSVRYYDESPRHKMLRTEIEGEARSRRDRKIREWEVITERHEELCIEMDKANHNHKVWAKRSGGKNCKMCSLQAEAKQLSIQVDEWPLPDDLIQLKATVFELDCPRGFAAWRDSTWSILQDLGREKIVPGKKINVQLSSYQHLQDKFLNKTQRLTFGSATQCCLSSKKSFPIANVEDVLLENGHQFRLIDSWKNGWVRCQSTMPNFSDLCASKLPEGPYKDSELQMFVDKSSTDPNEAIARQDKCVVGVNHHEFLAFASLRAGEHIQWLNVLRELGSADMKFGAESVQILMQHVAFRAGSSNRTTLRTAHQLLEDDRFCRKLLDLLLHHVKAVQTNWKEQHRLSTLTILGLRVLSLTKTSATEVRAAELLREIRAVGLKWCRQMTAQLPECSTEGSAKQLKYAILRSALVCHQAFSIDRQKLSRALENKNDVSDVVEASIYIDTNRPTQNKDLPREFHHGLLLSQKLSKQLFSPLRELLVKFPAGVDQAVGFICPLSNFIGQWDIDSCPNKCWIRKTTSPNSEGRGQTLNFNLLTGRFLVDGESVGRLPPEITEQALYGRVFGLRILNVLASEMPQMLYCSRDRIEDHEIHLGLHEGKLIIKAKIDGKVLRVMPCETFRQDLPHCLQHDYVHWMNTESRTIEFRPIQSPWSKPRKPMEINFGPPGRPTMKVGKNLLVEMRSSLGKSLTATFAPLETPSHLVATISPDGRVEVELPRFGLKFFVNSQGLLESHQLSSTVAEEQDIGCLYGLQNKLVLRNDTRKSVLIPLGHVTVSDIKGRKEVRVRCGDGEKIQFVQYYQNDTLGTLQGASSNTELLFKAYLHALTSFPRPDPLTQHTGTAEALTILADSRLRTSFPLSKNDIELLKQISELTPKREYHSREVKDAQRIIWHPHLDQLSQHEALFTSALEILSHNARFAMMSNSNDFREEISRGQHCLQHRAYLRNSNVRASCRDNALTETRCDQHYPVNNRKMESPRSRRAYEIAALVQKWPTRIGVTLDLVENAQSWKRVIGHHSIMEKEVEISPSNAINWDIEECGYWGYLYNLCRNCNKETHRYKLMFLFAAMIFGNRSLKSHLSALLAIAVSGRFRDILPAHSSYDFKMGKGFATKKLEATVRTCCRGFEGRPNESPLEHEDRKREYSRQEQQQVRELARYLEQQWPCEVPSLLEPSQTPLIDMDKFGKKCKMLFAEWLKNHQYFNHLGDVTQKLLEICTPTTTPLPRLQKIPESDMVVVSPTHEVHPTLMTLLHSRKPPNLKEAPEPFVACRKELGTKLPSNHEALRQLLESLQSESSATQTTYIGDLLSSLEDLEKVGPDTLPQEIPDNLDILMSNRETLLGFFKQSLAAINRVLEPETNTDKLASMAGLWPRTTPYSLLACLSAKIFSNLSEDWKATLTTLGEAICVLQRSERLVKLKSKNNVLGFYKEAEETGRQGWRSLDHPEWLLIEIESNIQIRKTQATIAQRLISPDGNQVLQLNMGEGKSSVITPMILVALANRNQLARLVVLKPLLQQTHTLISRRIGGLVNRSVYHLPFSRDTRLDEESIPSLQKIVDEAMEQQGVILSLPEHILSFRLLWRDKLTKQPKIAQSVMALDQKFQNNCRDVLDESDEILNSRSQLVYADGNQTPLDEQSGRWGLIQDVFSLLVSVVQDNSKENSTLEVDYRGRSFPFLTFLDNSVCSSLLEMVVEAIFDGALDGISFEHCKVGDKLAARKFVQRRVVEPTVFTAVKDTFGRTPMWPKLHLLRGLFAHKILDYALRDKLWLVSYGLSPDRSLMAVPYRAKGIPSASSHFSHPDLAIVLTCLSYYWGGLTQDQLRHAFEILMTRTDPSLEYERWAASIPNLPHELATLDGVNLDDVELWESALFPYLRFSKAAADFYMSWVVFPREGKTFPSKLSLSAWDLPSTSNRMPTVGFSGTVNTLIPTSIEQRNLPELDDTNAKVMELLLREENRAYVEAKNAQGGRLRPEELLKTVSGLERKPQVLIDVGSQVLEAGNEDVAKSWLASSPDYEGAVFFNEFDEIMVVDRDSHIERLSISPFNRNLDLVLVYLDEAHTRGIDIDLPLDSRAVVTLGPKTTKDHLVQGCMRMRKLGCNQSLVFLAPPDVHQAIKAVSKKTDGAELDSTDVLKWALVQTCASIESSMPLHISQGLEYCYRNRVCSRFLHSMGAAPTEEAILSFHKDLSEPDARTLEEMYGAEASENTLRPCCADENAQRDPMAQPLIERWKKHCKARKDPALEEEQEREISHEVEQQQEIQEASSAVALSHELHRDVVNFIKSGRWEKNEDCPFYPAYDGLKKTTAYKELHTNGTCTKVFVTRDFIKTVDQGDEPDQDQFIRPVNWVVSSMTTTDLVIISPFEANELLSEFQSSTAVRLHVYSPRASKSMQPFSDLSFFTITSDRPDPLSQAEQRERRMATAELDIFAGCLFMNDFDSYLAVCDFLGLNIRKNRRSTNSRKKQKINQIRGIRTDGVGRDGFTEPDVRKEMDPDWDSPFLASPIPFLRALIGIRRKGQAYAQTHMGRIIDARPLKKHTFKEDSDESDSSDA